MSELELLHKLELKIAIEIKRVCEKNNIRYCLAYGSLLGAVRHGGFIPWDDDLDIAMPRSDYERFIQVFPNEINQDVFFLENWDTEKDFGLSFSKVKLNGTVFEENSISKTNTHKGIFVDVFPYDCLPDNKREIRQTAKKLMILGKLYKFRLKYLPTDSNNKIQELLSKVIGVLSKAVPANRLKHRIYSLETKYNNGTDAIYMAVLSGTYNCRDLFPAAYLKNYINVLFEGEWFPIPLEYKKVLTCIYGNYMELPPIEKRILRHNAKRIDFGIYSDNIQNEDEGEKMIRILHSVSNMDRAGIETVLMNYYRHIDRSKIQFDFLCNKTKPGDYDEEIKSLGGRIFHTPGLNPFKYMQYLRYMKSLFREHPEYSILHAHNGAFVVYPLFAAKINKVPIRISHVHGALFIHDYKWPLKRLCKPLIPYCANYYWACGITAARFYYGKNFIDDGKIRVINNAIDVAKFIFNEEKRNEIRRKYGLSDKLVVGHVGRFSAQKNHKFLIEIFSEIKKIKSNSVLVLLGDGELKSEIQERINQMGLGNEVIFLGNLDNVYEWYQAMDVFVLPSIYEGLPVVAVEAQAADLPCIFSSDVTNEINLLPTTHYISRDESPYTWATVILESVRNYVRKDTSEVIKAAGYDINVEAFKLAALYEELEDNIRTSQDIK